MSNNPKISVITPAYNAEDYVAKMIESVQAQTFTNYEHIIIDDGSSDDTASIIERYAKEDARIHLIRQMNSGAAAARNKGIEDAQGTYITFIDGDDFVEEDMLDVLYKHATKYDNDLICFNKYLYNNNTKKTLEETWLYKAGTLPSVFNPTKDISLFTFIFAPLNICAFLKRDFIQEHQLEFDIQYKRNEDIAFMGKVIALATKASFIKRELYYYRVGTGSNMSSTLDQYKDDGWKTIESIYDFLIENNLLNGDTKKSFSILCCAVLWHYIFNMKTFDGQKYAFNQAKKLAEKIGIDKMSDPGDIYTGVNFYKEFMDIMAEDYDEYLWSKAQQSTAYEDSLIKKIDSLDATLSLRDKEITELRTELDSLRSSVSWKVTRPLRVTSNRLRKR